MSKKLLALLLAVVMVVAALAGCSSDTPAKKDPTNTGDKKDLKIGFVYIGDIHDGGYTQAHDKGRLALEAEGYDCLYKENVPESSDCETAILDLIDAGCNVIYTTSFGHGEWTQKVAKEHPEVYFGHATGSLLNDNMCNYMGRIEESRYLTGIVAGMATKNNKIGYVAAMPFAECIRGINAFTLGVQSVNPDATVEVLFTNTWYDKTLETTAAKELLSKGVDVLAQHQDSTACQLAAEEAGALAIGYNTPTPDAAPGAYLTAALFHWDKFYLDNVKSIEEGTWKAESYWKGLADGWVGIDDLSALAPEGAQAKVDEAKAAIIDGSLKLFQGEVKDQSGVVKATDMTDEQIYNMDWFIEGVIGTIG